MKPTFFKLFLLVCLALNALAQKQQRNDMPVAIEQWKRFELTLNGPTTGNPFVDVTLTATFEQAGRKLTVDGFYDGNGIYRVRFMPPTPGGWTYVTQSNAPALNSKRGAIRCVAAQAGNRGPVVVRDTFHFAYSDGSPHYSFGTTCYSWMNQSDSLEEQTLRTLAGGYFNKLRMGFFPVNYTWNRNDPPMYPFVGTPPKSWDFTRFNPAFFQRFDQRIAQLDSMGIEADLIMLHPYDRWGFQAMDPVADDRYIRYVVARYGAYKNVWWSVANEYDLLRAKTKADWDRFIQLIADRDPYDHPLSIHNWQTNYDHSNPLLTHVSIQSDYPDRAKDIRQEFRKPVIYDECRYEGNLPWNWGNLTAQEMTHKFCFGPGEQPAQVYLNLPPSKPYTVDLIDTWNMTIQTLPGTYAGKHTLRMPGKPAMALRIRRK
jgi:hypothetical protein